ARGAGAGRRPLRKLAQAPRRGEGFGQHHPRPRRRHGPARRACPGRARRRLPRHPPASVSGMKTVTILGATGSVGTSTLDLIERAPGAFRVRALTANSDVAKLASVAIRTRAERAVIADEAHLPALRDALAGSGVVAAGGAEAVAEAAGEGADVTV